MFHAHQTKEKSRSIVLKDMKSPIFSIILFSLLLYVGTIESRHEPGEYRKKIMREEPLPEVIKGLLVHSDFKPIFLEKKTDCIEDARDLSKKIEPQRSTILYPDDVRTKLFAKDIEPRPSATVYPNDVKTKPFAKDIGSRTSLTFYPDGIKTELFAKNIKPRPSGTFYPNDVKKLFARDVEPRPSGTFYPDDVKNIEPQSDVLTLSSNDVKKNSNDVKIKLFTKDIEPRPSTTFYPDNVETNLFTKDIKPQPSATFYPDDVKTKESSADAYHGQAETLNA